MYLPIVLFYLLACVSSAPVGTTHVTVKLSLKVEMPVHEFKEGECSRHVFHTHALRPMQPAHKVPVKTSKNGKPLDFVYPMPPRTKRQVGLALFGIGTIAGYFFEKIWTHTTTVDYSKDILRIEKETRRVTDDLRMDIRTLVKNQDAAYELTKEAIDDLNRKLQIQAREKVYDMLKLADATIVGDDLMLLLIDDFEGVDFDVAFWRQTASVVQMGLKCQPNYITVSMSVVGRKIPRAPYLTETQICGLPIENAFDTFSCIDKASLIGGSLITTNGFVCYWGGTGLATYAGQKQKIADGCYQVGHENTYVVDGVAEEQLKPITAKVTLPPSPTPWPTLEPAIVDKVNGFEIQPIHGVAISAVLSVVTIIIIVVVLFCAIKKIQQYNADNAKPPKYQEIEMKKLRDEEDLSHPREGGNNEHPEKPEKKVQPAIYPSLRQSSSATVGLRKEDPM